MNMEVIRRDAQIKEQVIHELRLDPSVDETTIGVNVIDGIVTLFGTTEHRVQRIHAQEAAHRVAGVLDVANDIIVPDSAGQCCTDTEIALAARRALTWLERIPAADIRTSVADGWITLEGRVPTCHARLDAEGVVKYLRGVRGVLNLITVQTMTSDATAIGAAMGEKLDQHSAISGPGETHLS